MNKYLGYFDKVFYINLDSRVDRRKIFEESAKNLNIPVQRFSAVVAPDNLATPLYKGHVDPFRKFKIGCTLSHMEIIKYAKENNLSNCLIFEDDCVFLETYAENIQSCVNDLKQINWDLFYLGGQPNNYCEKVTNNLFQIKNGGVYTTHAYAINHTFFDKVLNVDPYSVDTIDILYLNYDTNKKITILSKHLLCTQNESYSNLRGEVRGASDWMKQDWIKYVTE